MFHGIDPRWLSGLGRQSTKIMHEVRSLNLGEDQQFMTNKKFVVFFVTGVQPRDKPNKSTVKLPECKEV